MDLKRILDSRGIAPSKRLGQNFLIDGGVPARIAEGCGCGRDVGVLEIGPGTGALTVELAKRAARVLCLELDSRMLPILEELSSAYDNIIIEQGDIIKVNLSELVSSRFSDMPVIVCANLPYYISAPAITKLVGAGCFGSVTVMLQREVALRLAAAPGTPDYGALSVFTQYHSTPRILFEVPPEAFYPRPAVYSAVVRMDIPGKPLADVRDEAFFFRVVRAAFAHRRKTLQNCLKMGFNLSSEKVAEAMSACGLDLKVRGETLGVRQFARLADELMSGPELN